MRHVLYVELQGEGSESVLRAFLRTLPARPGFLGADLLRSPSQPGLALVQVRWDGSPPDVTLPSGARAWTFQVVESARPSGTGPTQ